LGGICKQLAVSLCSFTEKGLLLLWVLQLFNFLPVAAVLFRHLPL
jgi:hypothetical protein